MGASDPRLMVDAQGDANARSMMDAQGAIDPRSMQDAIGPVVPRSLFDNALSSFSRAFFHKEPTSTSTTDSSLIEDQETKENKAAAPSRIPQTSIPSAPRDPGSRARP